MGEICGRPNVDLAPDDKFQPIRGDVLKRHASKKCLFRQHFFKLFGFNIQSTAATVSHVHRQLPTCIYLAYI